MCRNKERVIINEKSGYLMRTEVCSSNEVSASSFINLNALLLKKTLLHLNLCSNIFLFYLRLILDALATSDWIGKGMCFVRGKKLGHFRDSSRKKTFSPLPAKQKAILRSTLFQGQVRMLLMRVTELEKRNLPVSN
ncbi:hypothetical protein YC2023_020175 [Brassica napus]